MNFFIFKSKLFVEALDFTKDIKKLLTHDEYVEFQEILLKTPDAGVVIQGTGGVRKIRWGYGKTGKRGGIRVIYYFYHHYDEIYFLDVYAKNERSDLTALQKENMKKMIQMITTKRG